MKWIILAENYNSSGPFRFGQACDPVEVIYTLCKIDQEGNILQRDGSITGCEHGWMTRLKEAIDNGVYEKREIEPIKEAKYIALKI